MAEQAVSANVGNTLVTKICFDKSDETTSTWLVKSLILGSEAAGFQSGEIVAPKGPEDIHWTLTQKFRTAAQASEWRKSDKRSRFLKDFQTEHAEKGAVVTSEDQISEMSTVTTAIVTQVKPGMESVYREWEGRVQAAQASFPGFRSSYFQPGTGEAGVWVSLLRFDSSESLDRWFNSDARKRLVEDAEKLVTKTEIQRVTGSFPGWVPVDPNTGKGPPNWKTFLLVLLGLYPIVMLEIKFLMPLLSGIPSAPANLFANSISVAATTWLTMPAFIKWFGPWLFPTAKSKPTDNIIWSLLIVALFVIEVALLWHLL